MKVNSFWMPIWQGVISTLLATLICTIFAFIFTSEDKDKMSTHKPQGDNFQSINTATESSDIPAHKQLMVKSNSSASSDEAESTTASLKPTLRQKIFAWILIFVPIFAIPISYFYSNDYRVEVIKMALLDMRIHPASALLVFVILALIGTVFSFLYIRGLSSVFDNDSIQYALYKQNLFWDWLEQVL